MALPKWTEERTARLKELASGESPVSRDSVASIAEELETTARSISSKLRKEGFDVELASAAPKTFSDEETAALSDFVTSNSGTYTYAEIADAFEGDYTAKAIQGKILSMELTSHVKETPKKETPKTYTDAEEATVVAGCKAGKFVEEIAEEVGKSVASVRGKALSLLRSEQITDMPKQRDIKGPKADALAELENLSDMSVADIATAINKTERGVKTMLTRRGLVASDYNGASKKEKNAS